MDRDPSERWLDRLIAIGLAVIVIGLVAETMLSVFTW